MSQCVPSWDGDDSSRCSNKLLSTHLINSNFSFSDVPMQDLDYEVAELKWENGQLALHGLGLPRVSNKPCLSSSNWCSEKPRPADASTEMLESIVDMAIKKQPQPVFPPVPNLDNINNYEDDNANNSFDLVPHFDHSHPRAATGSTNDRRDGSGAVDALVPCGRHNTNEGRETADNIVEGITGTFAARYSTQVASCGDRCSRDPTRGVAGALDGVGGPILKPAGAPRELVVGTGRSCCVERGRRAWANSREGSKRKNASFWTGEGEDSRRLVPRFDRCEKQLVGGGGGMMMGAGGLTSTSFCSHGNNTNNNATTATATAETSTAGWTCTRNTNTTTADDYDSVSHSQPQRERGYEEDGKTRATKSSASTKRSRPAAAHNQSERKRRDKINQRMKTLQKLVPNSNKTDKASMLEEVIDYLRQLQAQVQMMSRNMTVPSMMIPTAMFQLPMSMMDPMGMCIGAGGMGAMAGIGTTDTKMNMDMKYPMARANMTSFSPPVMNPSAALLPLAAWDFSSDRLPAQATTVANNNPLSTYLACQAPPMTMETYSRTFALYQQMMQQQQHQRYQNHQQQY